MENQKTKLISVYVGNLNYKCQEGDLLSLFKRFGYIKNVKVLREGKENKSKGIAFVDMVDMKKAKEAIDALNGKKYEGRTLKVSLAKTQDFHADRREKREDEEFDKAEKKLAKKIKRKSKKTGLASLLAFKNQAK